MTSTAPEAVGVPAGFLAISAGVVWANLATVDRHGRPRSRVVHPLWEPAGASLRGWVLTRRTPTKVAHLEACSYVSVAYWSPEQSTAVAECLATWEDDPDERRRIWALAAGTPPPLGFDPAGMFEGGPDGTDFALLRLDPWQLQIRTLDDLAAGRRPWVWRAVAA
jgi:hypothetical protein